MIRLYQPPPPAGWNVPNMSPFCVKLETYLRMAKLEYEVAPGNPLTAPKGKIPYVTIDGKMMGDSGLIIDYLKRTRGDPLDGGLTEDQRALAHAVRRMVEEHLYFAGAYLRWAEPDSFSQVKKFFRTLLPPVIAPLFIRKLRREFLANMRGQGIARHTREEVVVLARQDLAALARLLGDKPFFFGAEPTSVDASLFGFLVQLLWVPWESDLTRTAKGFPNLEAYCRRMGERYWAT